MAYTPPGKKVVYLTFDDGPIPEETPWVLDVLDRYDIKATFFMVGDNVRKHPEVFEEVKRRGHSYGNHTMHHLQGLKECATTFFRDITEADRYIGSILFRPPHGIISPLQTKLIKRHYNIIMYDVVTRDYSKRVTKEQVLDNVKRYTRKRVYNRVSRLSQSPREDALCPPARHRMAQGAGL